MAASDRYTLDLKCPVCGNLGEVRIEENDGAAFLRDPQRCIDRISPGFTVSGENMHTEYLCAECGVTANSYGRLQK
jgi:hypothetical protein